MNIENKWIKIQSYKHDGQLHRFWRRSFVLIDNEEWLVVASKSTQVIEGSGRRWRTREPAITFFSKKDWFNVIAMLKEAGVAYYVNVATPTLIDGTIAKYIDYDLDLKKLPGGEVKFLDKYEFLRHSDEYNYSDDLIKIITAKQEKITKMIEASVYPFDENEVLALYEIFSEKIINKKSNK
ncbi:MAG TPA: DUF402 domain-containing protein [Bacilli bacterium]|nr:DUF402 domain-containing protein [Bacilli bacterium]